MKRDINRAVFYSKQDLSKDRNLQNAEPIIEKFGSEKHYEINDILELHQIKLYFDNELYHSDWCTETQKKYIKTVDSFWDTITAFFININSENISAYFDAVDYHYYDSFWTLISQLSIYKKLATESLTEILDNNRFHIRQLLKQKNIVDHFSKLIKDYLLESTESA